MTGCGARVSAHGNLPDPERVAELKPGDITKQEINEILGSPSSVNTFGQDTWYYIAERTETVAFFEPVVKEREVLVVKFDKDGHLQELEHLDLKNGRQIAHVERITPTFGQELTVIGQILGNFQRFNKR
ncbi:MAG: outer membrane protein assembly factor BamE [Rhodospirillaceae bacterium]